jgi:hypothetical protein
VDDKPLRRSSRLREKRLCALAQTPADDTLATSSAPTTAAASETPPARLGRPVATHLAVVRLSDAIAAGSRLLRSAAWQSDPKVDPADDALLEVRDRGAQLLNLPGILAQSVFAFCAAVDEIAVSAAWPRSAPDCASAAASSEKYAAHSAFGVLEVLAAFLFSEVVEAADVGETIWVLFEGATTELAGAAATDRDVLEARRDALLSAANVFDEAF